MLINNMPNFRKQYLSTDQLLYMKIIYSERCLEYHESGHPESPARVRESHNFLKSVGYEFLKPSPASPADILKVHTPEHIERIKNANFWDPDSPAYENIYYYACLSAGGAILAAKVNGFSLMRPPGHHAGRSGITSGATSLGFCYFNNIAVAVKSLDKNTLILDIDGHHGNGTQDIFQGDEKTTYVSLHRSPHYPGTGLRSEGNCLNFPLSYNVGDKMYLETLDRALNQVKMDSIEAVAVSAGFDAHERDLMASLGLSKKCYRKIGNVIGALGLPTFVILEGGYNPKDLGQNIHQFIQGFEEKS